MTWNELKEKIEQLSTENMNTDVTILLMNEDEVFSVTDFITDWSKHSDKLASGISQVDGVLDWDHPFLTVITG